MKYVDPLNLINFNLKRSYFCLVKDFVKLYFYKILTRNAANLFLRGGDFISIRPNVSGLHEPKITHLIKHFSQAGYKDFLIDIGANIGLTSCQNGEGFSVLYMYEPNPLCYKILEVNTRIALKDKKCFIFNFGLGNKKKKITLKVPSNNWGGAYVSDKYNSYSNDILTKKDGFLFFNKKNYSNVEIEVRDTKKEMQKVFNSLILANLLNGVIKIDVEGYEPTVLQGIAKAFPKEIKAAIIFESLNKSLDMQKILKAFNGNAIAYKLTSNRNFKGNTNCLDYLDYLRLRLRDRLDKITDADYNGDIILLVN